ncbi:MAG: tetratricopeptide repeat protein [Deinococcales bacterium]
MKWLIRVFVLLVAFLSPLVTAQLINAARVAERNFADCRKFFLRLGDPITAESQCRSAVQFAPEVAEYHRLFARVLLELNKFGEASQSLANARQRQPTFEDDVIEAEIAFRQNQFDSAIAAASRVSAARPDILLRAYKVLGLSQQKTFKFDEALETFKKAVQLVPNDVLSRRALADLYLKNAPQKALAVLAEAPQKPLPLLADLGRTQWITGNLSAAIQTLEGVVAKPQAFTASERLTYRKALGALAYSYFGQGRFADGQRVMSQMDSGGNWFGLFISKTLPWLLGLVLLLALHLVGEARIEPLSTIEIQDGPRAWSVGTVYAWLFIALLLGGVAALFVGNLVYGNFFAFLTPFQWGVAIDTFLIVVSLVLLLLCLQTASSNGWKLSEIYFAKASPEPIAEGIALGLLMVGLTIGYQFASRQLGFTAFFADFLNFRPSLLILVLVLPFAEVFFCAFALYPFEKRYGALIGACLAATLFALTLISPMILLLLLGAGLVLVASRAKSVTPAIVAQFVFLGGLLVCCILFPTIRNWF